MAEGFLLRARLQSWLLVGRFAVALRPQGGSAAGAASLNCGASRKQLPISSWKAGEMAKNLLRRGSRADEIQTFDPGVTNNPAKVDQLDMIIREAFR